MRILILLLPVLALGACSSGNEPAPTASESTAAAVPVASPTVDLPAATARPSASSAAATEIPAAIRGRWGLVPADCTSTRGDAKGLLTIDAASLKFYESVGKLGEIAESSDTRLRSKFAFSGEGMNWSRDQVLDVQDGGKTLIRREYGDDAAPGPFKYARC